MDKRKEMKNRILIESDGESLLKKYLNDITAEFYKRGVKNGFDISSNFETILLEKIVEKAGEGKITLFEISRIIEAHGSPFNVVQEYIDINEIDVDVNIGEHQTDVTSSTEINNSKTSIESKKTKYNPRYFSKFVELLLFTFLSIVISVIEVYIAPFRIFALLLDTAYSTAINESNSKKIFAVKVLYFYIGLIKGILIGLFAGIFFSILKIIEPYKKLQHRSDQQITRMLDLLDFIDKVFMEE